MPTQNEYKSYRQKMFCKANPSYNKKIPFSCVPMKILNSSCHMFPGPVSGQIEACIILFSLSISQVLTQPERLNPIFNFTLLQKDFNCCEVRPPQPLDNFLVFSVWLQVPLQELLNLLDEFAQI